MRISFFTAMFVLALALLAFAQEKDQPRCENCGMFWLKSPTRVEFAVKVNGKEHVHKAECLGCMHDFIHETYGEVKPSKISIVDYTTVGEDKEVMIDAFKAHFIFGTPPLQGSMAPFVVAFTSEKDAEEYWSHLGGQVVEFAEMQKLMQEIKEEVENGDQDNGSIEAVYVCPCSGDCCSDIKSGKPGQCPKCGMELVKKGA